MAKAKKTPAPPVDGESAPNVKQVANRVSMLARQEEADPNVANLLAKVDNWDQDFAPIDPEHVIFGIRLHVRDCVFGAKPSQADLIEPWQRSRLRDQLDKGEVSEDDVAQLVAKSQAKLTQSTGEELDEMEETSQTIFYRDGSGHYLENYIFKASLKLAASISGLLVKYKGSAGRIGLKNILQHCVHIEPPRIYLTHFNSDIPVGEKHKVNGLWHMHPDTPLDTKDAPGHVNTKMGKMSIIKRREFLRDVEFTLAVKVYVCALETLTPALLKVLLAYGQDNGVGADRSQGQGVFRVTGFKTLSGAEYL